MTTEADWWERAREVADQGMLVGQATICPQCWLPMRRTPREQTAWTLGQVRSAIRFCEHETSTGDADRGDHELGWRRIFLPANERGD